jgi:hypothetical protein
MARGRIARWWLWAGLALMPATAVQARSFEHDFDRLSAPVKDMLMEASDKALDKLARPGAFSTDDAIRIILPDQPEEASSVMKMADRAGMTERLQQAINDAAGMAAGQAKPIFRRAIQRMTLKDTMHILSKDHGATNYLRKTSGDELHAMLRPIIARALDQTGATRLAKLRRNPEGLPRDPVPEAEDDPLWAPPADHPATSHESLVDNVTDQAMQGIFKYIGHQEEKIRKDPSDLAFKLMGQLDH